MIRLVLGTSRVFLTVSLFALVITFVAISEAEAAPYQQVVDNSAKNRFKVSTKWDLNTYNPQKYGKNYRAAKPAKRGIARYKVKTPRTGFYTVCASWPSNKRYNSRVPVRIKTRDGTKTKFINQRQDGGKWNRLGTWKLRKGDSYKIAVSRSSKRGGWIVADAFKIIKAPSSKGVRCQKKKPASSSQPTDTGQRIAKAAASYIGTPYYLGGPGDCVPNRRMDCSCLTSTAYKDATNIDNLPDDPAQQWNYGRKVSTPRPGDIVFYKEGTSNITHAGIYAGNNEIIHASNYFGKVVRSGMRWPGDGYIGARRLV